ncbi:MAG: hypothetical protein KQI35_08780, partial [Bacteroidetes bacterium]|nr:hypothetical protein [Bacteroidota bacterium]
QVYVSPNESSGWYIDDIELIDDSGLLIDAGPDVVCSISAPTQFSASASGGSPPYSYEWIPYEWLSDPYVLNPYVNCPDTTVYTLKVTDANGCFRTDRVTANALPYSTETNIVNFSFTEQTGPAVIDATNHSVYIEVDYNTDITGLVATFELSGGANATVSGVPQLSGSTPNDFTNPVSYLITAEDMVTTQEWTVTVSIKPCELDLKVLLQGPFFSSQMFPWLNGSGVLPLSQPYNVSPWNYSGTEQVTVIPNADIVDWVLIELRETDGDVITATSSEIIAKSAAFILKNGQIVDIDGVNNLRYDIPIFENLFLVVRHRNHVGIISASPLSYNNGTFSYDFTDDAAKAYGGVFSQIEVTAGTWAMMAGDGNGDGEIDNLDKNDIWYYENNSLGYYSGDFDMNSQVNSTDNLIMWKPNSGKGTMIPD